MQRFVVVCTAVLFVVAGCNRKEENIVAEVNGEKVFSAEFMERYKTYMSQGGQRDNILLRQKIVNNMINERLIFADCTRQGFDSDDAYKKRMRVVETQALLDRYARAISFDTIRITEQEAQQEFRMMNTTASARYLYAKTEEGALQLKKRLAHGETFNQIAKDVFDDPGLANNGGFLGEFGWGEMEPALEEAAFTLPLGSVSDPIKLNVGYAIVKPEARVQQSLVSDYDYAKVRQKLADKIQEKKISSLVKAAADEASKGLMASFHEPAVSEVYKNWNMLSGRVLSESETGSDLSSNISTMKLMDFSKGSWTVGDFVKRMEWTTEKQRNRVKGVEGVKEIALGLATREVLLGRANKMGLAKDSIVQMQVARLRDGYLLRRWGDSVHDTVGNSGWPQRVLDSMFVANKDQYAYAPEVNVGEILVRTETEAKVLRSRLFNGADFAALARKNSIRLWAAKQGGELGFGAQANFGVLGEKFIKARIGDLLGPEKVDPYWAVFKVLAKREGRLKTFDEAREEIAASLLPLRKQEVSRSAIASLRSRQKIVIHEETLASIVIQNDNQVQR